MSPIDSKTQDCPIEPARSGPTETRSLPANDDVLISARVVSLYTGLATQTHARLRCERAGPPFVRLGRRVFYRSGDLRIWIATNRISIRGENRVGSTT
jgi:predicted DNA-binding transcriptional regulator AlpA